MTLHTLPPQTPPPGARLVRKLIRTDGSEKELQRATPMDVIRRLIVADSLDMVRLRHWGEPLHVMLVDDLGGYKDLPINPEATKLYHANCIPGVVHPIRGDVVIVPDDDFATPDNESLL